MFLASSFPTNNDYQPIIHQVSLYKTIFHAETKLLSSQYFTRLDQQELHIQDHRCLHLGNYNAILSDVIGNKHLNNFISGQRPISDLCGCGFLITIKYIKQILKSVRIL